MDSKIEEIIKIIADEAGIPAKDINADSAFLDDLDLSSLEIMSIVGDIERKYSVKISEKELISIRTIRELAEVISK